MPAETGVILLAAGASTRLGRAKQLVRYDGEPLVRRSAGMALAATPLCVVVTGAAAHRVGEVLEDLPVTLAYNPDWSAGMGGSISTGLRHLPSELDGVMVLLCDQWRIQTADLKRLITAWQDAPQRIAAASWKDGFGPPVIFPQHLFAELRNIEGDSGAKTVVRRHADSVRFVSMESAADDLDHPHDLLRMRRHQRAADT